MDRRIPVRLLNAVWHRAEWPPIELLTRRRFDVVHSPHPLLLPSRRAAQVVTIHDLDFLDHPERAWGEMRRDYPSLARRHARRAARVVVPSRYTATEVERRLEIPRERIAICPNGAPPWQPRPASPAGGHLLFVGSLAPRKNLSGLLAAYARLAERRADAPPLVVAGAATHDGADAAWRKALDDPRLAGRVLRAGYVDAPTLRSLYAGACALVLPSFRRGVRASRPGSNDARGAGCRIEPRRPARSGRRGGDPHRSRPIRRRWRTRSSESWTSPGSERTARRAGPCRPESSIGAPRRAPCERPIGRPSTLAVAAPRPRPATRRRRATPPRRSGRHEDRNRRARAGGGPHRRRPLRPEPLPRMGRGSRGGRLRGPGLRGDRRRRRRAPGPPVRVRGSRRERCPARPASGGSRRRWRAPRPATASTSISVPHTPSRCASPRRPSSRSTTSRSPCTRSGSAGARACGDAGWPGRPRAAPHGCGRRVRVRARRAHPGVRSRPPRA